MNDVDAILDQIANNRNKKVNITKEQQRALTELVEYTTIFGHWCGTLNYLNIMQHNLPNVLRKGNCPEETVQNLEKEIEMDIKQAIAKRVESEILVQDKVQNLSAAFQQ